MLSELIEQGFGNEQDLNCAEKILHAANEVYALKLPSESLLLAAGFGGGMGVGAACGALTGGLMALSYLFVKDHAHESKLIKKLSQELFAAYRQEMGDTDCERLKAKYRTPEAQCANVILAAAKALETIIEKYKTERVR